MDLSGRGAIITGASQGLGKTLAAGYVAAGADVFLVARGAELLEETCAEMRRNSPRPDQKIACLAADVGDEASCEKIVNEALAKLPNLRILVNNAGIYGPMGPIETVDWRHWTDTLRINLLGPVQLCRWIIPHFRRENYGKIINLSGGGATQPLPFMSAYAASKVALVRLTETFAEELRSAHVDVNAIAPGALNTRMLEQVLAAGPELVGETFFSKSLQQKANGGAPLEKGANLAVFLGSAASDGITGRLLSAVWDHWADLPSQREKLQGSDAFTLRRVSPETRRVA